MFRRQDVRAYFSKAWKDTHSFFQALENGLFSSAGG